MALPPRSAPQHVAVPLSLQHWWRVAFLHWRVDPSALRPLVPPGLRLHLFEGEAWVTLAPFEMVGVRAPLVPPVPWLSNFAETNVRTYVEGSAGAGLWFLSIDADRLPVVAALRIFPGIPYHWSSSTVATQDGAYRYCGRRRRSDVRWDVTVEVGEPFEPGPLDEFLVTRWRAYSSRLGRLLVTPVEHQPWPVRAARAQGEHAPLFTALGLTVRHPPDLVHFSPGVDVRIGAPALVSSSP